MFGQEDTFDEIEDNMDRLGNNDLAIRSPFPIGSGAELDSSRRRVVSFKAGVSLYLSIDLIVVTTY